MKQEAQALQPWVYHKKAFGATEALRLLDPSGRLDMRRSGPATRNRIDDIWLEEMRRYDNLMKS